MTQQDEKKIGTDSREEPILTRPEFWAHPLVHSPPPHRCPPTPPPAPLSISFKGGRKTCLRPHSFPRPSAGVEVNTFYRRSLPTPLKPPSLCAPDHFLSASCPAKNSSEWSQEAWQRPNRPRQKSRRSLIRWVGAFSGKSLIPNQTFIIGFITCPCVKEWGKSQKPELCAFYSDFCAVKGGTFSLFREMLIFPK